MGQFTTMAGAPMEDTTTSSFRPVDKIIGSTVIPRRTAVDVKSSPTVEKFGSPTVVQPPIQNAPTNTNTNTNNAGMYTPSAQELQAMTAQAPDSGTDASSSATDVSTTKTNPLVMYAAIGIGAILIYKYFIK
jgi:hypothetical protein